VLVALTFGIAGHSASSFIVYVAELRVFSMLCGTRGLREPASPPLVPAGVWYPASADLRSALLS